LRYQSRIGKAWSRVADKSLEEGRGGEEEEEETDMWERLW